MSGRPEEAEVRPDRGWFHVRKEDLHSRSARETDPPFASFDVVLRGDYEDLAARVRAQGRVIEAQREALLLCDGEDVRLNGCSCVPDAKCYLHGVIVRDALADPKEQT